VFAEYPLVEYEDPAYAFAETSSSIAPSRGRARARRGAWRSRSHATFASTITSFTTGARPCRAGLRPRPATSSASHGTDEMYGFDRSFDSATLNPIQQRRHSPTSQRC